jgi:hypothetical protein
MRMAADTASDRSISWDVREVFILVDPLWNVGAHGLRLKFEMEGRAALEHPSSAPRAALGGCAYRAERCGMNGEA